MKFKGWDWTELLRVWPKSRKVAWPKCTKKKPFADEEAQAEWIRKRIEEERGAVAEADVMEEKVPAATVRRIAACREFVATVAKAEHHYDAKVFKAVAEIEDDETFLQYLDLMLEWMWT